MIRLNHVTYSEPTEPPKRVEVTVKLVTDSIQEATAYIESLHLHTAMVNDDAARAATTVQTIAAAVAVVPVPKFKKSVRKKAAKKR